MVRPSIQIEKKIAFIPPSRIRGISIDPSGLLLPRSKPFEKKRCVVSSCVSRTMEEDCSLRARADISSAGKAAAVRQRKEMNAAERVLGIHQILHIQRSSRSH